VVSPLRSFLLRPRNRTLALPLRYTHSLTTLAGSPDTPLFLPAWPLSGLFPDPETSSSSGPFPPPRAQSRPLPRSSRDPSAAPRFSRTASPFSPFPKALPPDPPPHKSFNCLPFFHFHRYGLPIRGCIFPISRQDPFVAVQLFPALPGLFFPRTTFKQAPGFSVASLPLLSDGTRPSSESFVSFAVEVCARSFLTPPPQQFHCFALRRFLVQEHFPRVGPISVVRHGGSPFSYLD